MRRALISYTTAMATYFAACSLVAAEETAQLIARCAPMVDTETLGAIVLTESSGHIYVLSDDGPGGLPWEQRKKLIRSIYPGSAQEAANIARELIGQGHLVGIGLTQINSQNLSRLGVSVEQLLDPCINLGVGSRLLHSLYEEAVRSKRYPNADQALGAAISAYNTGNFSDGLSNGYVRKVLANMAVGMPRLWASKLATRSVVPKRRADIGRLDRDHDGAWQARNAPLDVQW